MAEYLYATIGYDAKKEYWGDKKNNYPTFTSYLNEWASNGWRLHSCFPAGSGTWAGMDGFQDKGPSAMVTSWNGSNWVKSLAMVWEKD